MDNKRLLLATVLSFFILFGWQLVAEHMGWMPEPAEQIAQTSTSPTPADFGMTDPAVATALDEQPTQTAARFSPTSGREVVVDTPLYRAVFHSGGGVLQSFTLKKYNDVIGPEGKPLEMVSPQAAAVYPMGLLVNGHPSWNVGEWAFDGTDINLGQGESGELVFTGSMHNILITRKIRFSADTYQMDETVSLATEGVPLIARVSFSLASSAMSGTGDQNAMLMAWSEGGSLKTKGSGKKLINEGIIENGDLYWAGVMSNYFLSAVAPAQTAGNVFKGRIAEGDIWRTAIELPEFSLQAGSPATTHATWWLGPKDRELLKTAPNELADAVDLGWFSIIAVPLLWLLRTLEGVAGNWGVAIILLTLVVKILFWPLTRKSYKSMEQMKKIQPMMQQLQEKHGKDKEALSKEMMQLYKTYGVNPMGGCLPILIQLPVFVALYRGLMYSIELRHASFIDYLPFTDTLWLADLSVKDPFYITPIIMGATMFLQQWLSPQMGDPSQRKIMMMMPLIFTFMFVNFPAGLVIYWLCNNVFSIIQQWWTLRKA